jgi:hypothetical protein
MRKLSHVRTIIGMLLLLFSASYLFGQNKNREVFAPVPAEVRAPLIARFNQFFEYGRAGQWGNYYDLLYFKRASAARREYFIEQHRKSSPEGWSRWMVEVYPESVRRNDGSIPDVDWIIEGQVNALEQRAGKHSFRAGAILRDREWFFSEPTFGTPPFVCTPAP